MHNTSASFTKYYPSQQDAAINRLIIINVFDIHHNNINQDELIWS